MINHQESSIHLSSVLYLHLDIAFGLAASRKTAFPPDRPNWTREQPYTGHCVVVTLAAQDWLGGDILFNPELNHSWNRLPDGSQQDFTRNQFQEPVNFNTSTEIVNREQLLYSKEALAAHTPQRYRIFTKNALKAYTKIARAHYRYKWPYMTPPHHPSRRNSL